MTKKFRSKKRLHMYVQCTYAGVRNTRPLPGSERVLVRGIGLMIAEVEHILPVVAAPCSTSPVLRISVCISRIRIQQFFVIQIKAIELHLFRGQQKNLLYLFCTFST